MKKLLSFLLSLLFLTSPFSYGLNLHYCGEQLVDIASFFVKAEGCGMEPEHNDTKESSSFHQSSCCDDVVLLPDLLEDFSTSSEIILDAETQVDLQSALPTIGNAFFMPNVPNTFTLPRPPLLVFECYKEYNQLIVYG